VGIRNRFRRRRHDERSIRLLLEECGASPWQAAEIVRALGTRLRPDEMHAWLSDPERSHPVPDPESAKWLEDAGLVPVVLRWMPVSAIAAGRADLVIIEARRFAARTGDERSEPVTPCH